MSLWILDTDHISLVQRADPSVSARLLQQKQGSVAITIISIEEQLRGRLRSIRRARKEQRLLLAYQQLLASVKFFENFRCLPFDQSAYERYVPLRSELRVGTQDLRIGAIALSQNAILVTRNRKDFEQIPGLRIEDWSVG